MERPLNGGPVRVAGKQFIEQCSSRSLHEVISETGRREHRWRPRTLRTANRQRHPVTETLADDPLIHHEQSERRKHGRVERPGDLGGGLHAPHPYQVRNDHPAALAIEQEPRCGSGIDVQKRHCHACARYRDPRSAGRQIDRHDHPQSVELANPRRPGDGARSQLVSVARQPEASARLAFERGRPVVMGFRPNVGPAVRFIGTVRDCVNAAMTGARCSELGVVGDAFQRNEGDGTHVFRKKKFEPGAWPKSARASTLTASYVGAVRTTNGGLWHKRRGPL